MYDINLLSKYILQGIATFNEQIKYNEDILDISPSDNENDFLLKHTPIEMCDFLGFYDYLYMKHPITHLPSANMVDILSDNRIEQFFKSHNVTNIDYNKQICFCDKEQKWYGWCKRTAYGFKIGDKCETGQCGVGDGYIFNPGDTLKTLDNCKQRAIDFAKAVD